MLKNLFRPLAFVLRILFPYKRYEHLKKRFSILRSLWLHHIFLDCHKTVVFGKIGCIHGSKYITIDEGTFFDDFFCLTSWPERVNEPPSLIIGSKCSFGTFCHITCANKIHIGNCVLTGKYVTISDNNHGNTDMESLIQKPYQRAIVSKGPIIIEDDVWIGDKATILSGVKIGKGAVVAANSVVTKDVPEYSVVAGNPARIIRNNNEN